MAENNKVQVIMDEIKEQLSNKEVAAALVATTFKGLDMPRMSMALREGMILGFKFEDFLKKDVYAIPYGQSYSLVTSIDHSRKIAMRSGQTGKSAPIFTYTPEGKVDSCTITIKSTVGEFTATVFFDEYTTGKNLWVTKPRTMLAKVAEMHALRMAFPEEMAKQYVEEEFERQTAQDPVVTTVITDEERQKVLASLEESSDLESLQTIWLNLTAKQREDGTVKATAERLKVAYQTPAAITE